MEIILHIRNTVGSCVASSGLDFTVRFSRLSRLPKCWNETTSRSNQSLLLLMLDHDTLVSHPAGYGNSMSYRLESRHLCFETRGEVSTVILEAWE